MPERTVRPFQLSLRGLMAATLWCGVCFAIMAAGLGPSRQFPLGLALTVIPAGNAFIALFWNSNRALFAAACWFACGVLLAAAGMALAGY